MTIEQLNADFAIPGQLQIVAGQGGLPMMLIDNPQASAKISLYGGQVLSYRPTDQAHDLLFCSELAYYQAGKAIKGGIPVCWPWFGADPDGQGRPAHGFARNRLWQLLATDSRPDGATQLILGFDDDTDSRQLWPHSFSLRLTVTVGADLQLSLTTTNTGDKPFDISQALHSYFAIGDIARARVVGLEGNDYLDKTSNGGDGSKTQVGAVTITEEVDRIYTNTPSTLFIEDAALNRRIQIDANGSHTTVVWNPWAKIAAQMADLGDDDYQHMLCVETANAADEIIRLPAGGEHRLGVRYQISQTSK